jgi:RibD C-terminal domain
MTRVRPAISCSRWPAGTCTGGPFPPVQPTLILSGSVFLVDEFRVMIDPVVVGGGKRLFRDDGGLRPLRLVDSQVTTTGVIIATYAPADG